MTLNKGYTKKNNGVGDKGKVKADRTILPAFFFPRPIPQHFFVWPFGFTNTNEKHTREKKRTLVNGYPAIDGTTRELPLSYWFIGLYTPSEGTTILASMGRVDSPSHTHWRAWGTEAY